MSRPKNLVGSHRIIVEKPLDLDYRRIVVFHWEKIEEGDWVRWNPKSGLDVRTYAVLANRRHPTRLDVHQALLIAPVPDIVVAGVLYPGPKELPPRRTVLDEAKVLRWARA